MKEHKPQKLNDYSPHLALKMLFLENDKCVIQSKIESLMCDPANANERMTLRKEIRSIDEELDEIKKDLDSFNVIY